jgi:hypothetical protein
MTHQILGTSVLAPFRPNHEWCPALDEAAALGFNLVRTFCGPLPWCGQERGHVYDRLPAFLQDCADRGLNAYLSYCTEAGTGYDLDQHVDAIEDIVEDFPAVVLREVGNEPWHPTQGGRLTPSRCGDLAGRWMRGPTGDGAAEDDESDAYAGGAFVPVHLSRSRDKWNQVRRVRELLAMSEQTGKPVLNQEPIGADEASIPGKRESDPAFYFTLGALNRLFLGGNGVFHSQSGLMAERLGPNQRRCAEAYIRGVKVWPGAWRLQYQNSNVNGGWGDSPVQWHDLNECVRAYSGVDGNQALVVQVGISTDAEPTRLGAGWRLDGVLGNVHGTDGRGCLIWRAVR